MQSFAFLSCSSSSTASSSLAFGEVLSREQMRPNSSLSWAVAASAGEVLPVGEEEDFTPRLAVRAAMARGSVRSGL